MAEKKKNNKNWIRPRHAVIRNILYCILTPYRKIRYGIKIDKFREQENRPYLILLNHQTPFDQFVVGISLTGPIYYMATEDIFSMGWISNVIRWLIAPIPIKKQTTDVRAILNCMKVAKEGGSIAIAPEGNRTYCGRTVYMSPSIVPLARKLGMPIVLYRIEGGYGVEPRWSDVVRRGKMHGYISRVISPEEYADMSDDQLFEAIEKELFVNEAVTDAEFKHKKLAEYLERAIYVCPECGLSTFESNKDLFRCKKCGLTAKYLPNKTFEGIDCKLPFRFVADWYDYQSEYVNSIDVTKMTEEPLYVENVELREVIPYEKKIVLSSDAKIILYGDRVVVEYGDERIDAEFVPSNALTVLGRNKLNIYYDGKIYQIKGDKRFNALKYVQIFHRSLNISKGEENVKFLGL